ncbi:MAG: FadR family transcriptional regulator [Planctomycetota bacterium]|nr:FadR family transcriptional regulator [Planctomycetota bacterium]
MEEVFNRVVISDNLASKSIDAIIHLIRSGKLKCGERLPSQGVMAKKLGVSRTSLREAFKELSYRGIIESRHGLGTFVCQNLISERETVEARLVLESGIATLAAKNGSHEAGQRLLDIVQPMGAMVETFNYTLFSEYDLNFHNQIVGMSGNNALMRLYLSLNDMTLHQQLIAQQIPGIMVKSHEYHLKIAEAIVKRNAKSASSLMRRHLEYVHAALIRENGTQRSESA